MKKTSIKMKTTSKKIKWKMTYKIMENTIKNKMKTTSTKNLFLIPLKFRGKPFLGLAQLSKIFIIYVVIHSLSNVK